MVTTIAQRIKTKPGYKILLIIGLIAAGMTLDYETQQTARLDIVVDQKPVDPVEIKIASMMRREQSPAPEAVAAAVARQKRPRLMAAVAVVESNGTATARGKAGEVGAFQVTPKHWGAVPAGIDGQADQAAAILERLIAEENGRLRPALSRYNGDKSGRYAAKVMAKVEELK